MTQKEIELKIERIENSLQLALSELQAIKSSEVKKKPSSNVQQAIAKRNARIKRSSFIA